MEDFIVPKHILHQINEFSTGGYLVLVFDEEGNPQVQLQMDSVTHIMAMEKFLERWLEVVHESQLNAMMGQPQEIEPEEFPDDDEEDYS